MNERSVHRHLDAFLGGHWGALKSAVLHLNLPVATLTLVYMTLIIKHTRTMVEETMNSDFVQHARAMGFKRSIQLRYAVRNALPPVVTVVGIVFWFLNGGAAAESPSA